MDPTGFQTPSSFLTSMSAKGAIMDRPEAEIDQPEVVSQPKPVGMALRSQSHGGRSEVVYARIFTPKDQGLQHGRNRK